MARKRDGREGRESVDGEVARAVAELAGRVSRLEGQVFGAAALVAEGDDGGDANAVFTVPPDGAVRVLAALSSAPRLALYRAALAGPVTSADLMAAAGLNTTGQLYHHLRELVGVGLMAQEGRDRYTAVRERVPAARAIVRAALGIAQITPFALPAATTKVEHPPTSAPVSASSTA